MNQTISLLEDKRIVHGKSMLWMEEKKRGVNDMSKEPIGVVLYEVGEGPDQGRGTARGEDGADEREPEPLLLGCLRDGGRSGEVKRRKKA